MTNLQPWQTLESRVLFQNARYTLREDSVLLPNGLVLEDYLISQSHDVALVVPITLDQEFILVKQYRHAAQAILLEFPAGSFVRGSETALAAAQRELLEETGYTSNPLPLAPLAVLQDNPVRDTSRLHIFLAYSARKVQEPRWDSTEELEIYRCPRDHLLSTILRAEAPVSGCVAAAFLALQWLNNHGHGGCKAEIKEPTLEPIPPLES